MAFWTPGKQTWLSTAVVSYLFIGFVIGVTGFVSGWVGDMAGNDAFDASASLGRILWTTVAWPTRYLG